MLRKLTFGDDHSPGSDTAWQWIMNQAWPEWVLDIITVEKSDHPTEDSPLGYDALREYVPETLREVSPASGFAEVHYLTAHHDPRVVLGTCPDSTLLVVGPRGKGLLKAMHIGSTVEWLMQCPSTPLVIARQGSSVERIVVAVDGSSHADAAVKLLTTLPFAAGATITVVGIVESENEIRTKVQDAADLLATTGAQVTALIVEPDPLSLTMNPRATLIDVVKRESPQLVALGTRGMTGLPRMRVGSVASAVAHHVDCSVLLVRDAEADDTHA